MGSLKSPSVALVHDFLLTFAGAERVLKELSLIFPEAPIYTLLHNPEVSSRHFPGVNIIPSKLQKSWLKRWPQLLLGKMPQAVEEFDFSSYDLVISSSGAFSHGIITGPDTFHLCYCHSPMRYVWDWHNEYLREKGIKTGSFSSFLTELLLSRIRLWDSVSAKRVDSWVANSTTVAGRIQKFYRQESEVVYPPVDTEFLDPAKLKSPHSTVPYAVTVSRLTANKRIHLLIEACAQEKLLFKVIGSGGELINLQRAAKKVNADVQFLGNLSEEEKREVVGRASCFLFAAEDDFGIAPVEALSLGVPVIAFARGGTGETVQHGKNGRLFSTPDPAAIRQEIASYLKDGVSLKPEAIRASALPFSRKEFAQQIRNLTRHA